MVKGPQRGLTFGYVSPGRQEEEEEDDALTHFKRRKM
jgi:hypothetical protein